MNCENGSGRLAPPAPPEKGLGGVTIIWGSPSLGAKSIEAISHATSNKIVGWVVRLQNCLEWTLVGSLARLEIL